MLLKTTMGLAFAAACTTAIAAVPAAHAAQSPAQNISQSRHYDRMVETNRAFRQARINKTNGLAVAGTSNSGEIAPRLRKLG